MSATFVVTVADAPWFVGLLAKGLYAGKVEALNAVAAGDEKFLRPDGETPAEVLARSKARQ